MDVVFTRTGERRYGVTVTGPQSMPRGMDPAPGYDDHIPHDLVHYIVEAELRLSGGLYGRAAQGGGSFLPRGELPGRRQRRRLHRKAARREAHLRRRDHAGPADMHRSERLTALCDAVWRMRHAPALEGGRPPWVTPPEIPEEDRPAVERIVARLEEIAPLWNSLKVGESLIFTWPDPRPVR
ncbi:hypothetical protein [Thermomonospora catenispora]|uniref:hypothetical protein n=1 Tax=Thermomonospora catenispora TaxID=2493090 RepID=UPI00111F678B|nr:hypothetical protein [Thermomonospora catenispora]TNY37980.1 hypothetical protein EIO00_05235 [Thermomonospora catenispora]